MYNIWLVQRVRWAEPLAKPRPELLSPHTLYYTNIPWYTVPNGSARLQAVVSAQATACYRVLQAKLAQSFFSRNTGYGR